jgi:flagellar basal body-associated protein FliL
MDDGTVFRSMKEFYWWVLIVTCLIALLGFSIASALFSYQQVRKAEAILQRAEQLEKKQKPKLEPKPEKEE